MQLADGLGCPVEDLIGVDAAANIGVGIAESIDMLLPDLQRAMVSTALDRVSGGSSSWQQTAADIRHVRELRYTCEYRQAARLAAHCLPSAHDAIHGPHRADALPALAHLYFDIALAARMLGDIPTAWMAADRCRKLGGLSDDTLIKSGATFAIAHVALAVRAPDRALDTITEHLAEVRRTSPELAGMRGMLHMTASLAALRSQPSDPARSTGHFMAARDQLDLAAGQDDPFALNFGHTNLLQWQMALALDAGDHTGAVATLAQIVPSTIASTPRLCKYNIDLARVYAATDRPNYAVRMLVRAQALAPQYCAHQSAVKATVNALQRRSLSRNAAAQLRLVSARHP
jgi:hypothetical protein